MHVTGERRGQLVGAGLATLWLVVVLVADLAISPSTVILGPLYAIAPLIACAVLSPAATVGFAATAVVLTVGSGYFNHVAGTAQQTIRVIDVVLVSAVAVVVAAVRVRRERQYARVVRIAEVAQRAVLPVLPARVGPVAAGARYLSATEDALVGGDLYDWFHSDRRTCFVVGDVRGKGVGAVEQAARVIRAFRQSAAAADDIATVAHEMSAYLAPFLDDEEFATATLLQVTSGTHVTLVSCGHPPPLLVGRDGARLLDPAPGLPLGLGGSYEAATLPWTPGDRLLLYTDGLSEARDRHGTFLPLLPLAPLLRAATIDDALDRLLDAVHRHVPDGQFTDDLVLLLLENISHDERSTLDVQVQARGLAVRPGGYPRQLRTRHLRAPTSR